jgi:hypothetical protein
MSDRHPGRPSRRRVLQCAAAALAAIPLAAAGSALAAESAKASQASMKYQDHPNGKQHCDGCMQFIPGSSPKANGTCKVVAGKISPQGWCIAFAPKP